MSEIEEMAREQLGEIIARTELRAEQQSIHANSLAPYGAEAKKAQCDLRPDASRSGKTQGNVEQIFWEVSTRLPAGGASRNNNAHLPFFRRLKPATHVVNIIAPAPSDTATTSAAQ
jgi:hypothetical protein